MQFYPFPLRLKGLCFIVILNYELFGHYLGSLLLFFKSRSIFIIVIIDRHFKQAVDDLEP